MKGYYLSTKDKVYFTKKGFYSLQFPIHPLKGGRGPGVLGKIELKVRAYLIKLVLAFM